MIVMLLLNGGGLLTLKRCREMYAAGVTHLGRLARPRHISMLRATLDAGLKVGVDNDAFSHWDLRLFVEQIGHIEVALYGRRLTHSERIAPLGRLGLGATSTEDLLTRSPALPAWHENLLFVAVPDVPFDARATARRFAEWAPGMSHLPLALCVQDGAADVGIPWGWPNLAALFMAGSTDYKLSSEMADICREGKRRGLHIHGGRVNSDKRIRYMAGLGFVDSIDGTGFDQWRDKNLGRGLAAVSDEQYQLSLTPQ